MKPIMLYFYPNEASYVAKDVKIFSEKFMKEGSDTILQISYGPSQNLWEVYIVKENHNSIYYQNKREGF